MERDPKPSPLPSWEPPIEPSRQPASPRADAAAKEGELIPPRLPVRAAIYLAPDGTVHFGALFQDLAKVAESLGSAPGEAAGG